MADSSVLEIPEQVGLAVATARKPQARRKGKAGDWPAGTSNSSGFTQRALLSTFRCAGGISCAFAS